MFIHSNISFARVVIFAAIISAVSSSRIINFPASKCRNTISTNFTELTEKNGYNSEAHSVVTEDGYILTIFRMYRNGRQGISSTTPVLLLHGMLQDASAWIDSGPNAGLAYLLCDAGYDTWVGNMRGNTYSMKHVYLNPDTDAKFWDFSPDEIGSYDIPAMIDYILDKTNTQKLNYIGFSESSGAALMMFSDKPNYCTKVGVFIALAAPTTFEYSTFMIKPIIEYSAIFERVLYDVGIYKAFTDDSSIQQLDELLCILGLERNFLCKALIDVLVTTPHPGSITESTYDNVCSHFPGPTTIKTSAQYGQAIISGRFQKYDYGTEENLRKYGSSLPPQYNLSSVQVPVVLGQGSSDTIVTVQDSEWLAQRLPNVEEFVVDDPMWNHMDMTYSRYTGERLFPKINEYLLKYSNSEN